ncbi:MAG TPA: hypothetical protein VE861_07405 [Gemmatimonadaceae bacterium]|nr:hypothetical protein [Gemmatimonadaceae bacterium]
MFHVVGMNLHALTAEQFGTDDDVRTLLDVFEKGTLPRSAWNHRAHLTVALAIGRELPLPDAIDAARAAIHRFNAAAGIVSTPDSGYHETLTVFYMQVVALHVRSNPLPASRRDDANALVSEWGARDLPLRHYSRDRLFSRAARRSWMEPDLQPLPTA